MLLKLDRPIIAFDVETHDMCPPEQARIVELGFIMFRPDGTTKTWQSLVNPGVPISTDTTKIHHITDEMVKDSPKFKQIAESLTKGFNNCDYAGYNVKFDLRVLQGEMNRVGVKWNYTDARLVDGLRLWQISEPRTLGDAVQKYVGRKLSDAHRAMGDAQDAWDAIEGILKAHDKLPRTVQEIHDLCFPRNPDWVDEDGKIAWKGLDAVLTFGKWVGTPLHLVETSYLNWMLNGNFSETVKLIVRKTLAGEMLTKE